MDTAGKAVLFSGVTVLISLSAVMLVPSPAFRSMSLGIMLSVAFVLLATLTLLPAMLAWLGDRVDRLALPWVHAGEHRSPRFAAVGEPPGVVRALFGLRPWRSSLLALPVLRLETGMPSIKVVPKTDGSRSATRRCRRRSGRGARDAAGRRAGRRRAAGGGGARMPTRESPRSRRRSARVITRSSSPSPPTTPSDRGRRHHRPAPNHAPAGALVGGAVAENHDLEAALAAKTLPVFVVVLGLGFLLLLVALQAPLIALAAAC